MSEPMATLTPANGELKNRVKAIRLDNQIGAAKSGRGGGASWLPWLLCGVMALTWAGAGIRWYKSRGETESNLASTKPVETGTNSNSSSSSNTPSVEAGTIQLEVKGYLVPPKMIAVSPIDVGGRVISLNIVEGKYYNKGDVLAQLDPASYVALVDESSAMLAATQKRRDAAIQRREELKPISEKPSIIRELEVKQIQAQLQEAEAQQARTTDQYNRLVNAQGASGQEVVTLKNDKLMADGKVAKLKADLEILVKGPREEKVLASDADVLAAEADVKAANARLTQAKWRLDNCTIRAPISGTVLTKKAEEGNLVNPQAFAGGSGSVCELADLSDLEADLKIPEKDISKLVVGQPCRIRVDAYPNRQYEGKLDRIMPTSNRADNTVNVRVKVKLNDGEAPGTYLKPEMGAVVSFLPMK